MIPVFSILASAVSLYTMLCVIRIIITWIPSLSYSTFARFLSAVCDPFLNMFRRLSFLRFSMIDFSPLVGFGLLYVLSALFSNLANGNDMKLGKVLAIVLNEAWLIVASILLFLIIFLVIRLVILLMGRDGYSSIWSQIDTSINPLVFRIAGMFSGGRPMSYKNALILAVATVLAVRLGGSFIISQICRLLFRLPF